MITLESRVNGELIYHIYAVNKSEVYSKKGVQTYHVKCYRVSKKPLLLNFKVTHNAEEGIEKLSLIIYKKLDNILKKNKD